MFESRKEKAVIAKALKIVGSVTAEGLVEVNGRIDGELHGTSLVISHGAEVAGRGYSRTRGGGWKSGRPDSRRRRRFTPNNGRWTAQPSQHFAVGLCGHALGSIVSPLR